MDTQTHVTLLERLREPCDPLAWDDFYQRYWRLIFATARRRSPADRARPLADDGPLAALADPASQPDAAWERGFDLATLAALLDVVRHEVTPATFQAFELAVLQEMPGADVARVTGLSRNAVYLARRRILARLKELGARVEPAAALVASLREAMRDAPKPAVERAATQHAEQTLLAARSASGGAER